MSEEFWRGIIAAILIMVIIYACVILWVYLL
jgi:hypothetical protein